MNTTVKMTLPLCAAGMMGSPVLATVSAWSILFINHVSLCICVVKTLFAILFACFQVLTNVY